MDLIYLKKVIKKTILFLLLVFLISGCTKAYTVNDIKGKWLSDNTNMMFVFDKDNNCKEGIYDKKNTKDYLSACTYKLSNNRITLTSGDEKEEYKIGFRKKRLVLTTLNGNKIILKRTTNYN